MFTVALMWTASMSTKFKLPTRRFNLVSTVRATVPSFLLHLLTVDGWDGACSSFYLTVPATNIVTSSILKSSDLLFTLFLSMNQVSLWSFQPPLFCLSSILPGQRTLSGGEAQNGCKWTMCFLECVTSFACLYQRGVIRITHHTTKLDMNKLTNETNWLTSYLTVSPDFCLPISHSHPPLLSSGSSRMGSPLSYWE